MADTCWFSMALACALPKLVARRLPATLLASLAAYMWKTVCEYAASNGRLGSCNLEAQGSPRKGHCGHLNGRSRLLRDPVLGIKVRHLPTQTLLSEWLLSAGALHKQS